MIDLNYYNVPGYFIASVAFWAWGLARTKIVVCHWFFVFVYMWLLPQFTYSYMGALIVQKISSLSSKLTPEK